MLVRTLAAMLLTSTFCGGCSPGGGGAAHPSLVESRLASGESALLLKLSAEAVTALEYSAFLGNPGMVVGTDEGCSVRDGAAIIAGAPLVPIALATWPIACAVGEHEEAGWWPLLPLVLLRGEDDQSTIYVSVSPETPERCKLTAQTFGKEPRRTRDMKAFWQFIAARCEVIAEPDHPVPTVSPPGGR